MSALPPSSITFPPRRVRRRGLIVLLANTYLMWSGFFMIIPVLSLHFVDDLRWPAAWLGIVLGVRQFLQQTLTVVGGALADRLGAKRLIVIGLGIRTMGFAGAAHAVDLPALMLTAVLAAVGGSLFDSPSGAAIAALTTPEERPRFYSVRGVMTGLGLTTGPWIGSRLLAIDFALVAYLSAALYIAALLLTAALLPNVRVGRPDQPLSYGVRLALRDRSFVTLTALLMGYWFMWVQLSISLPLKAEALSGLKSSLGDLYTVNALVTIVLQVPIVRWIERRFRPMPALTIGVAIMALGLGCIGVAPDLPIMLVCIAVFSVGNLIALTNQNTVIANLARPEARGSYFGVSAMGLAMGGSLGNVLGSALYGESVRLATPAMPWLAIMFVGLSAALGLWLLSRRVSHRQAAPAVSGT